MFTVTTDTTLVAPNIEDLEVARATAEQFASTGYTAYIRDDTTGETIATVEVPEKEDKPMTHLDYANANPDYHSDWCVPWADASGERFLIMQECKPQAIDSPEATSINGDELCDFDSDIAVLAQTVNPDYDTFSGYTDAQIALMAMHETGCAACPFRLECDFMRSEIENT